MFYNFDLLIEANTPESAPAELDVKLSHGVITHVEVEFPPGCAGLVHAYVHQAIHQVWPTNPDGKFATDSQRLVWYDYYELFQAPYQLTIAGWNEDDTFDHQLTFRFEVTPQDIAERGQVMESWLDKVRYLLGLR